MEDVLRSFDYELNPDWGTRGYMTQFWWKGLRRLVVHDFMCIGSNYKSNIMINLTYNYEWEFIFALLYALSS